MWNFSHLTFVVEPKGAFTYLCIFSVSLFNNNGMRSFDGITGEIDFICEFVEREHRKFGVDWPKEAYIHQ
jgi:hypothetical protein